MSKYQTNLRKTFIILLSLAAVGVTIVLTFTSSIVIYKDIIKKEKEDILRELEKANNIINQESLALEGTLLDWAYWDDTYNFIQDLNSKYITNNLNKDSLRNIKVDVIAFYNPKGNIVYNLIFNKKTQHYETSEKMAKVLSPNFEFFKNPDQFAKYTGFILLNGDPTLIVMSKVLTSHQEGPAQGTLLFGRFLDSKFIKDTNQNYNINMNIIPIKISLEEKHLFAQLQKDEMLYSDHWLSWLFNVLIKPKSFIVAFHSLPTANKNYSIIIKASKPRGILWQGITSLQIIILSIFVTTIIFILLTYWSFNKLIISRILAIGNSIENITLQNNINLRIPTQGNDEITSLTHFINNMLSSLEVAQNELQESELRFRSFVTYSYDGIILLDHNETITLWNKSMERMFSTPESEVIGKPIAEVLWNYHPLKSTLGDMNYHRFKRRIAAYFKALKRRHRIKNVELQLKPENNKNIYIELTAFPIKTQDSFFYGIIIRNISHRKNLEEKLHYISTHDSLTKLYNRYFFDTEIERFQDSRLFPISIILFDIDNLKIINDTYGHSSGDKILENFGKILLKSFRSEDIVARIGGDEFAALLPRTNEQDAQKILNRVQDHLIEYNQQIYNLPLQVSAGLVSAEKGEPLKEKLIIADMLMYQQKSEKGKSLL